jgi:hypothetical protein
MVDDKSLKKGKAPVKVGSALHPFWPGGFAPTRIYTKLGQTLSIHIAPSLDHPPSMKAWGPYQPGFDPLLPACRPQIFLQPENDPL